MTKTLIILAILMPIVALLASGMMRMREVNSAMSRPQLLALRNSANEADRKQFNFVASIIVDQAWTKTTPVYFAFSTAGLAILVAILLKGAIRQLPRAWLVALFLAIPTQFLAGLVVLIGYGFRHG